MLPALFTHVIVTFSKMHHFITSEENARLMTMGNSVRASFGDFIVNTSDIAEIVTISKYYEQYPDKRPGQSPPEFKIDKPEEYLPLEEQAERSKARLHGLLIGLKRFCDNNESPNAKITLKKKIAQFEKLYGPFDGIETELETASLIALS